MPTILAIETSSELASAALLHNGQLLFREASGFQTHSQTLLPMVQAVLAEAGIALADVDAIGFGAGPGSFTGVRTACGVAQGLGFGAGRPLVPVVTLEAMAEACRSETGAADVLVLLDARMEEVYWAQYRWCDGWQTVIAPRLGPAAAVAAEGEVVACGNGLAAYASAFAPMPFAARGLAHVMPHAKQIALLAARRFAAGVSVDPREASPLYLRDKVALTTSERNARAAA
ncbi:MAG TPA: tRNA (adenosine(37)-N6)-threonylcarbamoyltransferase complex dimerization subunit type 1 TsaB [Noviherbaspirillum sp.]|nr:tRNA (adenosine(37)-N6)-threonylcarbamoyltransferase complex dimerization subunit type 1 TsaB [Noviherbaspirillum sp.]